LGKKKKAKGVRLLDKGEVSDPFERREEGREEKSVEFELGTEKG